MTPHSIPSSDEVRAAMHGLSRTALRQLHLLCGVSLHTLIKIRDGSTADPGIDTVRKLWPHLPLLRQVFITPEIAGKPAPPLTVATRRGRPKTATFEGHSTAGT